MMTELWKSDANWFATWFNTPAYHALYGNRDESEAEAFIARLAQHVLNPGDRVMDMGCGAGRHAASLNRLGFDTTGLDLSANSIETAKRSYQSGSHGLNFVQGDMRNIPSLFPEGSFGAVFSLFTSIGYFQEEEGLENTMSGVDHVLQEGGGFVLDFLNPEWVRKQLVPEEIKEVEGYTFHIHRRMIPGWIEKSIQYTDKQGAPQHHVERVRSIAPSVWQNIFAEKEWELQGHFGDYELNPWSPDTPRSILVARKISCG